MHRRSLCGPKYGGQPPAYRTPVVKIPSDSIGPSAAVLGHGTVSFRRVRSRYIITVRRNTKLIVRRRTISCQWVSSVRYSGTSSTGRQSRKSARSRVAKSSSLSRRSRSVTGVASGGWSRKTRRCDRSQRPGTPATSRRQPIPWTNRRPPRRNRSGRRRRISTRPRRAPSSSTRPTRTSRRPRTRARAGRTPTPQLPPGIQVPTPRPRAEGVRRTMKSKRRPTRPQPKRTAR